LQSAPAEVRECAGRETKFRLHTQWNAISQRAQKTVNNNSFDVFILQKQQPLFAAAAAVVEFLRNKSMSERKSLEG